MVGCISFHDPPDSADLKVHEFKGLELGHSVFKDYRQKRICSKGLYWPHRVGNESTWVRTFVISLSPKNEASMALAQKLGYVKVTEQMGPIDGLEEVYVLEGQALEIALDLLEFYPSDEAT